MSVFTGGATPARSLCAHNGTSCRISCLLPALIFCGSGRRTVTRCGAPRIFCLVLPHVYGGDFLGKLDGARLVESSDARLMLNGRVRMHSFAPSRIGRGRLYLVIEWRSLTMIEPFSRFVSRRSPSISRRSPSVCRRSHSVSRRSHSVSRRNLSVFCQALDNGLGPCRFDDSFRRLNF